jgi:CBS domain containing-hemolysin-like protein
MTGSFFFGLLTLLPLCAVGAFFVFAEYSLVVSRSTRIAEFAEKGIPGARAVQRVMRDPDRFFAATQIGITLNSLLIGLLSEPAFSGTLGQALVSLGLPVDAGVLRAIGTGIGLVFASYLQIVLSELVPRSITLAMAERIALLVVPLMSLISALLSPFIWLLKTSSRLVIRLLRVVGLRVPSGKDRLHTAEELRMLLEASEEGGVIDEGEAELIDNALDFSEVSVREVMVPRTEMICLDATDPLEKVMHTISAHSFDRYPVFNQDIDHITGILHVKDLARAAWSRASHMTAGQLMRQQLLTVPDSHRADEVLAKMRSTHSYLAIVLDEYGGTAGLVSLYDLLVTLAGGIGESKHDATADIHTRADGTVLVNGLTNLGDFGDEFNIELKDDNYDTIGGYVMGQLGRIPAVGDEIAVGVTGPRLRVEAMDGKRVEQLRVIKTDT